MSALLEQVIDLDPEITKYMPDPAWSVMPINRTFAYTIFATVRPEFILTVFKFSFTARMANKADAIEGITDLQIDSEIKADLLTYPYSSGKSPRGWPSFSAASASPRSPRC